MNHLIQYLTLLFCCIKQATPIFCVNCKFFKSEFNDKFTKFGKCTQFPIITYATEYLVTGIKDTQYQYCSIVRQYDDLCGEEGKLYEGK